MNINEKMSDLLHALNRRLKRGKQAISLLTSIALFAASYAMIMPATTLGAAAASVQENRELSSAEESGGEGTVAESEPEKSSSDEKKEEEATSGVADKETAEEDRGSDNVEKGAVKDMNEEDVNEDTEENTENKEDVGESDQEINENSATDATDNEAAPIDEEDAQGGSTEEVSENIDETAETPEDDNLIKEDTRLTYEGNDYFVYADFGETAKLPQGVELRVRELVKEEDSDLYDAYSAMAMDAVKDRYTEKKTLSFARFYAVSFVLGEDEVKPAGEVKILIEYKEPIIIANEAGIDAVCYDKDNAENTEILDSMVDIEAREDGKAVKSVTFESEMVFVYGIIGTETDKEQEEAQAKILKAVGDSYEVTVTFAPEAVLPEDAVLEVSEIKQGTPEYEQYKALAESSSAQAKEKVEYARFFNIRVLSGGEEIKPDSSMKVDIRLSDRSDEDELSYKAVKIQDEQAQDLDAEIGEGISFDTDEL